MIRSSSAAKLDPVRRRALRRALRISLAAFGLTTAGTAGAGLAEPPPRALTPPTSIISPQRAGVGPVPIATLFKTANSYSAVWGDHGSIIYNSDQGGRMNLWLQPANGPARLLLPSEERELFPRVTPDGKWVIYQSDHGGGEIYDLYVAPATGGAARNLTMTDDVNETMPVPSPDSRLVAYSSRVKTAAATDLGVADLKTGAKRLLTHEADGVMMWTPIAFSPDGRSLIANRTNIGQTHGAVYRVDLASGAANRLTAEETNAYNVAGDLSSDGRSVSVTLESPGGDRQAAILDAVSGKLTVIKPDRWEQRAGRFSPDGKTLLFASNVDGRDVIYAYDLKRKSVKLLPLPVGVNTDYYADLPVFSSDGRKILFPHSAGDIPLEYWIYDTMSHVSRRATHMASLEPDRLPKTQVVHYASADGTVVSGVLWVPYNLKRDGHAAGVIYPHGGPTGQTKDSFDQTPAALASRGYMVLAPNPRGSTGYGRAFLEANRNDLGGGDLQDEVAGLQFLVATGYVDPAHVGVTGGSYGGFMTMMAISKTPSLWAAAVDEFGIVNWESMFNRAAPPLREYIVSLIGDPEHNKAVYTKTSPLTFLSQETAPLLVLQGENDIRVPKEESEQIVAFLRARGRTVDVHYYPEEGHGFSKREDQIDALTRTVDWFDRFLKPVASSGN
jgi:dipeptidyl aminopeptidase/acylaminoacyl peptidase